MSNAHISQEQWAVVGGDPTPGDPDGINQKADVYRRIAENASSCHDSILRLATATAGTWEGDAADKCRAQLDSQAKLPADLVKLEASYTLASDALRRYSSRLRDLQGEAALEVRKGVTAQGDESAAAPKVNSRSNFVNSVRSNVTAQESYIRQLNLCKWNPAYWDPTNPAYRTEVDNKLYTANLDLNRLQGELADAERKLGSAQGALDDARNRLKASCERIKTIKGDRDQSVNQTVKDIEEAGKAGIQNKTWWQKFTGWVAESWVDVLDWISKNIHKLVLAIALIIAVVALVAAPFTGGASLSLLGVAFKVYMLGGKVAAVIKLACDLALLSQGRRTWTDIGISAAFVALSFAKGASGKGLMAGKHGGKSALKAAISKSLKPVTRQITRLKQYRDFVPKHVVRAVLKHPGIGKAAHGIDTFLGRHITGYGTGYKFTKHIMEKEAIRFWKREVEAPIKGEVRDGLRDLLAPRPRLESRYQACLAPTTPPPVLSSSGGGGAW